MLQSSQRFCHLIKHELDDGFGFVPFVGSGLSAGSGIPTGQEILDYLAFCIDEAMEGRWSPRKDRWPDLIHAKTREERRQWIKETVDSIQKPSGTGSNMYDSYASAIRIEAIGALSNWRAALHFLSRLDIQEERVVLGAPDTRVTDSFFINLIRDRRPNPAHTMLAHLATVMRIRTILTTNFDTLIEDTFAQAQIPLVQFDVPLGVGLPDPSIVLAQRSIIKLHGGRYGLRADFSLDAPPPENDMVAFMGYLSVCRDEDPEIKVIQNHLLVLGTSGYDKRTLKLIDYALKHDDDLKVFWVCYDADAENRVQGYFSKNTPDYCETRIHTITEQETDLFLFELYQRLTLSLPPASGMYPAFWTVPPYPYRVKDLNKKRSFDGYKRELTSTLNQMIVACSGGILAIHGMGGVSSVVSDVYGSLSREHICVWLDLARFYGEDHLFAMMTSAIAQRLGVPLGVPITLVSQHKYCGEELDYYVRKARKPIVVFLNGRDGPDFLKGKSRVAAMADDWESEAWYPNSGNTLEEKRSKFWGFLEHLQQRNATYPPTTKKMSSAGRLLFVVLLRETDNIPNSETFHVEQFSMPALSIDFDTHRVVDDVQSWLYLSDGPERERQNRFVYALSLFRYAIHPAALCSWALIKAPVQCRFDNKDNDHVRAQLGEEWLGELVRRGAVRGRPGGFAWMHEEVRIGLQERLNDTCANMRAECHEGIADWYAKLFRSSSDPCAALESLRHRMYCVTSENSNEDIRQRVAFIESINTLRLARNRILSCGYSRPFAVVVERIYQTCKSHNHMKSELSVQLQEACLEIQRDLFRELADFPEELKVIKRQRSIHKDTHHNLRGDKAGPEEPRLGNEGDPHYVQVFGSPPAKHRGLPPEYFDLELEYKEAVAQTGLRLYDDSEGSFTNLLGKLYNLPNGVPSGALEPFKTHGRPTLDEIRRIGRQWIAADPDDPLKKLMVRTIRRYMFLLMLKAQLLTLRDCKTEEGILSFSKRSDIDEYQVLLKRAETFYCLATELMRHICDHDFLQRENALIRTNYGVLLGNMRRFVEAHRRLNEASAFLKQSGESPDSISWAIIDLRRAEVQLTEACDLAARWIERLGQDPASNSWRQCVAITNDAQMHLDSARSKMEGHRKNVWWWTWSYQLQVSICAMLCRLKTVVHTNNRNVRCWKERQTENLGSVCRLCDGKWKICVDLFAESMRLTVLDALRQARLIELFLFLLADKCSDGDTLTGDDHWILNGLCDHLNAILQQRKAKGLKLDPSLEGYRQKLIRHMNSCNLNIADNYS
jgi:hypothetical protein